MEASKNILHPKLSIAHAANIDKGGSNLSCGNVPKSDMNVCESFFPYRTLMTCAPSVHTSKNNMLYANSLERDTNIDALENRMSSKISAAYESNLGSDKSHLPCKRSLSYGSELDTNKKSLTACKSALECVASSDNFANLHSAAGGGTQTSVSQNALNNCGKGSPVRTVWVHVSDTKLSTPHTTVPSTVPFDRGENQNSNLKLKCLEAADLKNQNVSHDPAVKKPRSLKQNPTHEMSHQKELRNSGLSEDSGQRVVSCIVPQRTVASNSNPKAAFPSDCSVITSQSKTNYGHLPNYAGDKNVSTAVLQSHEPNNCAVKPQKYNDCNQLPLHKKSVVVEPQIRNRDLSYEAPNSTTSTASTSVPQPYIYSYNYDLSGKTRNFQTPLSIGSGTSNFQAPFPQAIPEAKNFQTLSPLNLGVKNVSQTGSPCFEPNFNPNAKPLAYYSSDSYGLNPKNPPVCVADYKNSSPVVSQDCRMNSHAEERVAKSYSGEHFYAQGYAKQYETKVPPELNSYVCHDGSQIIFHEGNLKNSSVNPDDKIIYLMFPEENVQNLQYQGRSCSYNESSNFPSHERNVIVHPGVNSVVQQFHPVIPKQSFQSIQFNGKPIFHNDGAGVSLQNQSQQPKENLSFETLQPAMMNVNCEVWHEGRNSSDSASAAAGENSLSSEQTSKSSSKTQSEVKSFSVDTFKKLFSQNESQKPRPVVPQNVKSFSSETFLKEFSQKFK